MNLRVVAAGVSMGNNRIHQVPSAVSVHFFSIAVEVKLR